MRVGVASSALQNHPALVEAAFYQVLLPDAEIELSGVSPHHVRILVAVQLKKQSPIVQACFNLVRTRVPTFVGIAKMQPKRNELAFELDVTRLDR